MIIFFIFSRDAIQKGVKLETSLLAERRFRELKTGELQELFQELVMDEEYDVLFKRLFDQARAEIVQNISSNYLTEMPTDMGEIYREFPDFQQDRDVALYLKMHCDFPLQYKKSIDVKIEQFLIDYICWRWLETKSPDDAVFFFSRLETLLYDIRRLLIRKSTPMRRLPSFP